MHLWWPNMGRWWPNTRIWWPNMGIYPVKLDGSQIRVCNRQTLYEVDGGQIWVCSRQTLYELDGSQKWAYNKHSIKHTLGRNYFHLYVLLSSCPFYYTRHWILQARLDRQTEKVSFYRTLSSIGAAVLHPKERYGLIKRCPVRDSLSI